MSSIEYQHVTGAWMITDYDSPNDADALPEQKALKGICTFRARFDAQDRFKAIHVTDAAGNYLLSVREMLYPIVRGRLMDRQDRDGIMLPAVVDGVPIVWTAIPELEQDPGTGIKGAPVPANQITFGPADPDANGDRKLNLADVADTNVEYPEPVISRMAVLVKEATDARDDVNGFVQYISDQMMPEITTQAQAAQAAAELAEQYAQDAYNAVPSATHTVQGKLRLAGDLSGTADAPTVPGLAVLTTQMSKKADLDSGGKIPQAQLPAIAVTDFLGNVGSQAAMLALNGQRGDWCNRTDLGGTEWQLIAEPSSSLSSWIQKVYPASEVTSVAGRKGAVTLSVADVSGAAPLASPALTGSPKVNGVAIVVGTDARLTDARDTTVDRVTDASAVGKSLMAAASASAARTALAVGFPLAERGAWLSSSGYTQGDVVTYNNARWSAKESINPGAWNASKWIFLGGPGIGTTSDTAMAGDRIQLVASLPASPVAGVLYCIPE